MATFADRLRTLLRGDRAPAGPRRPLTREQGRPPSANGASSMHAHWVGVPDGVMSCSVDLTVLTRPTSDDLHFWALQASFVDRGRSVGAGHLGLQHYPLHPASCAVNWGGYHAIGGELSGSDSPLPSTPGNVNTRDYHWSEGATYRLGIERSADGWLGSVTDLASGERVDIRELHAPPTQLGSLIVWSEVFAPCEGPSSTVRWSNMTAHTEDGASHHPPAVSLTYQSHGDGGCTNTNTAVVDGGVEQTTATIRRNHHGETLHL